jgi:hypothetical protein
MKANNNGDLEENLFKVMLDGKEIEYQGRHVKRPAPVAGDYVTIRPGQTISYKVELSGVYDLKQAGNYTFQYNTQNMNLFADKPVTNYKAAIMVWMAPSQMKILHTLLSVIRLTSTSPCLTPSVVTLRKKTVTAAELIQAASNSLVLVLAVSKLTLSAHWAQPKTWPTVLLVL